MRRRLRPRDPWPFVAIACALGFVAMAFVVNGQGTVWLDAPVISIVRASPVPADAWRFATELGGLVLVVVGVAIVVALLALRRVRLAAIVAVAIVGGWLFTETMKLGVARPRPPGEPLVSAGGWSFPSGHTLNSTVAYGIAALLAWRSGRPRPMRVAAVAMLVVLVACVGLSRIALGVHYPSDVVAGWLAGTTIVAIVAIFDRADRERAAEVSRPSRRP